MAARTVEIIFKGVAEGLSATMSAVSGELETASQKFQRVGDDFTKAGKKLSTSVTLPLVAVGGVALKTAVDFEKSMSQIVGLVGRPKEEVEGMRDAVLSLSGSTARAPKELADALFSVTSAGFEGGEALDVLEAAAKAAAAGLGSTQDVALTVGSAVNAYGSEVLSAGEATDILVATVREGNLSAQDLAGALSQVLPIASAAGVGLEEVGAAVAIITRSGATAGEAVTQVTRAIQQMLAPTARAAAAMERAGISTEELKRTLDEEGLIAALRLMETAAGGDEAAFRALLGSSEALSGALTLLNTDAGTLDEVFDGVANSGGSLDRAFETASETGAFALQQAFAELKVAGVELGENLIPVVTKVAGFVGDLASAFAGLPEPVQNTVLVMGGIAATAGPAFIAVGNLARAASILTDESSKLNKVLAGPGGVAFGIGAVTAGLIGWGLVRGAQEAEEYRQKLDGVRDRMAALEPAVFGVVGRFDELMAVLPETADGMEDVAESVESITEVSEVLRAVMSQGLSAEFEELRSRGVDVDAVINDLDGNLDRMASTLEGTKAPLESVLEQLSEGASGPVKEFVQTLIDMHDAGEISREEIINLLNTLDGFAAVSEEARDRNEDLAKSFFDNGQALEALTSVYGFNAAAIYETVLAQVDASESSNKWAEGLLEVERRVTETRLAAALFEADILGMSEAAALSQGNLADVGDTVSAVGQAMQFDLSGGVEALSAGFSAMLDPIAAARAAIVGVGEDAAFSLAKFNENLLGQQQALLNWRENLITLAASGFDAVVAVALEKGPEASAGFVQGAVDALEAGTPELVHETEAAFSLAAQMGTEEFSEETLAGIQAALNAAGPLTYAESQKLAEFLIAGLIAGIDLGTLLLQARALKMSEDLLSVMSEGMQVASPSRATIKMGEELAAGLVVGMDNGAAQLASAAQQMAAAVIGPLEDELAGPSAQELGQAFVDGVFTSISTGALGLSDAMGLVAVNVTGAMEEVRRQLNIDDAIASYEQHLRSVTDANAALRQADLDVADAQRELTDAQANLNAEMLRAAEITGSEELAILRAEDAFYSIEDRVAALRDTLMNLADVQAGQAAVTDDEQLAILRAENAVIRWQESLERAEEAVKKTKEGTREHEKALNDVDIATLEITRSQEKLTEVEEASTLVTAERTDVVQDLERSELELDEAKKKVVETVERAIGADEGAEEAQRALELSEQDLETAQQNRLTVAGDLLSLQQDTAAQFLELVERLSSLNSTETTYATVAAPKSQKAFDDTGRQVDDTTGKVGDYTTAIANVPDATRTDASMITGPAEAQLAGWKQKLASVPKSISTTASFNSGGLVGGGPGGFGVNVLKSGGPILGARDEPVPILGHGGEFVLSANVVDAIKKGRATRHLNALPDPLGGGGGKVVNIVNNIEITVPDGDPDALVDKLDTYFDKNGGSWRG